MTKIEEDRKSKIQESRQKPKSADKYVGRPNNAITVIAGHSISEITTVCKAIQLMIKRATVYCASLCLSTSC